MISPCFHLRKQEAQNEVSPSNRLLRRYISVVAVLFVIGSVAPGSAIADQYGSEVILDAGIVSAMDNYALLADNDGYITKVNPQTSSGDRSSMNDKLIHEVKPGETVSTIAASYGLKTSTVLWENRLTAKDSLKIGQKLLVPPVDGVSHKVSKGEDVGKIAKAYGVDSAALMKQNKLVATNLTVGQELFIPGAKPIIVDAPPTNRIAINRAGTSSGRYVVTDASIGNGGAILPANNDKPVGAKPFIYPSRGGISQGYRAGHYAVDIADRSQPPIWAAGSGKVVKAMTGCARVSYGCGGGYGNHVIIDHGNGLQTLYAHLDYISVTVGQQVSQGEFIGKMGRTGNVRGATGIHLHFEVRKNGVKQVPSNYY